jgi:aryl-alcohol dehydrogenase-like predicted oxidoreductase
MKYRLLGNSGLRVSEAALGAMTFGDEWGWGSPQDEARKVYDAFREAGGNFIDTANFYTNGTSESFSRRVYEGPSPERGPSHEIHHVCSGHRSERGR